jgi:hypothetical protein
MKTRILLLISALALALTGLATVGSPANAATVSWAYSASAGGTYVHLLDNTITSDLTASSNISGSWNSTKSTNHTAAAKIGSLGNAGAIETSTTGTVTARRTTIHGTARTAGINLLGGLIRANAITTNVTSWAKPDGTHGVSSSSTEFVGLHISGINVPVNIPRNWHVRIPGVATISANFTKVGEKNGTVATLGWALNVTLLQARDGMPAGAVVVVNPINQYFLQGAPGNSAQLQGGAFATQVSAHVGDQIQVVSSPLAYIATPFGSSHGTTLVNDTASAHVGTGLNALLHTAAIRSTSWSTADRRGNAEIRNSAQVAGLSLLGGLIKADAIHVTAHARYWAATGKWSHDEHMTLVNLVVAGQTIPLDVSPNTTIDVANLGKVQINRRVANAKKRISGIDAVRITLDTSRAGLPVGAVIELGAAATEID